LSIETVASGAQVVQSLANATIVNEVDTSGPAAQAVVDSIKGSYARAGSPLSSAVIENAGFGGVDPNQVPVFAVSSFPVNPEATQQSPGYALHATSGPDSSAATAEVGGPASAAGGIGSARVSVTAECTDAGVAHAVADSVTDSISVAGVLSIGSVRSHAEVTLGQSAETTVDSTIAFEGVAVLGQPVAITESGLVIGPTVAPLPQNPLAGALEVAGISVRYLEAVKDNDDGTAIAPGVEIKVTYAVPGVGTGPLSTTFTLGQAYAHAALTGVPAAAAPRPSTAASTSSPIPTSAAGRPTTQAPPAERAAPPVGSTTRPIASAASFTTRLVNWSIAAVYYALALGTFLSVGVRAGCRKLAVRFGWT
jgi:hypothetical protein